MVMVCSDFRKRTISIFWCGIFALSVLCYCISTEEEYSGNIIANLIVAGIITAFTSLYLILRNGRLINPLKGYIGTGDLLFVICLVPLWNASLFLIFLIVSFGSGIIWWLVVKAVYGRNRTIPLAGIMGIDFLFYHTYEIMRNAGF